MPGKQHQTVNFFILSFLLSVPTAALSAAGDPAPVPEATPIELGAEINNLVVTGTVHMISERAVLITPHATYFLAGGDFQSVIGRKVNIIGRIIKEGSREHLVVARAQLAGNEK